jgi:hypothetical protein
MEFGQASDRAVAIVFARPHCIGRSSCSDFCSHAGGASRIMNRNTFFRHTVAYE